MINLQAVYFQSEVTARRSLFALLGFLIVLLIIESVVSPWVALGVLIAAIMVVGAFISPTLVLGFLAIYLPFEPLVLKFVPDALYVFSRFFSEGAIYLLVVVVAWRWISGRLTSERTSLNLPFGLFILALLSAAAVHAVPLSITALGLRQILRFPIIFFLVVALRPSKAFIQKLTFALFIILLIQSALGIAQYFIGQRLDSLLIASDTRSFGELTLTSGVEQFWDPGSRVFATLGRYDRLGNFLYLVLLIASGFLFTFEKKSPHMHRLLWWVFALGIPTLVLTYSRSSWFAFLIGFLFIGLIIKRDKKVFAGLLASVLIILGYLAASGITVDLLAEAPGQTVTERFFEAFSYTRWRGEYFGLGRVFWYVQTPATVIVASPILGWGAGQFGGGAVAALHNTRVYDELDLPFGIFGTEGHIDNNWFSLWGEAGTLGLVFFIWMGMALWREALRTYYTSSDPYVKGLAIGLCAILLAVSFNGFTSTIFEIRTVGFYVWMYGGMVWVLRENGKRSYGEQRR
ncbi:hypothetical protein HZA85_02740 [Candidatus Uhrbacteria bacterium]|nr:hypothetical protein [Candidatus Uhrbacteria bacterium]